MRTSARQPGTPSDPPRGSLVLLAALLAWAVVGAEAPVGARSVLGGSSVLAVLPERFAEAIAAWRARADVAPRAQRSVTWSDRAAVTPALAAGGTGFARAPHAGIECDLPPPACEAALLPFLS